MYTKKCVCVLLLKQYWEEKNSKEIPKIKIWSSQEKKQNGLINDYHSSYALNYKTPIEYRTQLGFN